ncbi:MAG: redoxin domain-containing protein [Halobacteria archaeon]|nr:redoxin domain-containing protein [Halobacteria archaeon]
MVELNQKAPNFTVPKVDAEEVGSFTLENALGDGPIVLAFFPGAFTSVCEEEMCEFRDSLGEFNELNAQVYGVSVDGPFAQQAFINQNDLNFPLLSDFDKRVIDDYDVVLEDLAGIYGPVAKRAVFVLDSEGEVTYKWVSDDPGVLPDFDDVKQAVEDAS